MAHVLDRLRTAIAEGSTDAIRSELERVPTGLQAACGVGHPTTPASAIGNGSGPWAGPAAGKESDPA
jgi:hypothetical protein